MTTPFDPYHRWLAIPKGQRPPTFYQLLGVAPTEGDAEVIEEAALRQASHVRTYQTGPHAALCTALLNEIGQARVTLLNAERRRQYDAELMPPPRPTSSPWEAIPEAPVAPRRARRDSEPLWAGAGLWVYIALLAAAAVLGYMGMHRPPPAGPPKRTAHDARPHGGART